MHSNSPDIAKSDFHRIIKLINRVTVKQYIYQKKNKWTIQVRRAITLIALKWNSLISQCSNVSKICRWTNEQCRPWSECSIGAKAVVSQLCFVRYICSDTLTVTSFSNGDFIAMQTLFLPLMWSVKRVCVDFFRTRQRIIYACDPC